MRNEDIKVKLTVTKHYHTQIEVVVRQRRYRFEDAVHCEGP